jgi:hypothetical protein
MVMQKDEPATGPEVMALAEEMEAKVESTEDETDKINVDFGDDEALAEELMAKAEEIKARIAEMARQDSRERSALTPDDVIIAMDDYLRYGRIDLNALLTGMAEDERYTDIKAITTATGLIFVYSDLYIAADDAVAKSLVEEAKFMLAATIRGDSLEKVQLTPVAEIYAMAPDTEPKIIDVVLKGMQAEERYSDIKTITAANGDVYYHSDRYLVTSYAATQLMAMAADHCATIVQTVRDDSRIYPTTTNAANFRQQVYGIPPEELEAAIDLVMRKPEYSDIKKMVHPVTGAVHLYSDLYLNEESAWAIMDWDEVGRDENP